MPQNVNPFNNPKIKSGELKLRHNIVRKINFTTELKFDHDNVGVVLTAHCVHFIKIFFKCLIFLPYLFGTHYTQIKSPITCNVFSSSYILRRPQKFCEISTVDFSYVVPVKSTVEILQNFIAYSEYMNFKIHYM